MIDRATILRRLARFDVATMDDLREALGASTESRRRAVWRLLNLMAADGLVAIDKSQGMPRYRLAHNGTNRSTSGESKEGHGAATV